MMCRQPYNSGIHCYPCGQCMPCRFNRRRIWTHRILLESLQHRYSAFATLTYDDEQLPSDFGLDPSHPQLWLKRLRKSFDQPIRYYLVGEYGDATKRPHYHAALFGFPPCKYGTSKPHRRSGDCCPHCDLVRSTWGMGHIFLGNLSLDSAQYVAGYVTKKLTSKDDPRLGGRHPEFARMSLRPGIGFNAMPDVASTFLQYGSSQGDVPSTLRHGDRLWPLGRYLRRALCEMTGRETNSPELQAARLAKVLPLWETAQADFKEASPTLRSMIYRELVVASSAPHAARQAARSRIFKKRGKL